MHPFHLGLKVVLGTVAGFLAQVIVAVMIGLLIVAVNQDNHELRMSGGYLIFMAPVALFFPRLLAAAFIATICNVFAANHKQAFFAYVLSNAGLALAFGLYAGGLLGPAL